jgi:hypothetical protein
MPKVVLLQTNFTAGEIAPAALGRTDLEAYQNGAEILENVRVLKQGGARRREGLGYRAAAKNALKRARMIPFVFSTTDSYMLEFGEQYIRFYKNDARLGAPYEVVTPYTEAQLFDVDYVQGADTMFLVHPTVPPQRLRRFGDTNWQLDAVPWEVVPFEEIGHSFSVTLTLSAATVGAARTATASGGVFQNSDVGREIYYQGGTLKITGFTSATVVTGDIISAFPTVNVPADLWTLAGTPQEAITPSAKDPVETSITLTATALNTWRASDVGKFVRVNGGLVQITAYTSPTVVSGTIKQALAATVAAPKNSWTLEAPAWSTANGYPSACTLYQQRLVLGGSPAFPQTVWGSTVGAYLDFTLGSFDSDAFAYTLASDQINPIRHLASGRVLFALTYGGEFTIKGGVEKPITPTNVQVDNQAGYGSSNVRPVRVGKEILFVQRAGLKVRALTYSASDEDYDADDVTELAEHITGPGIVDLCYQQEPIPVVHAVRSDGVLASCTYVKKSGVAAWTRATTDGVVESVASIPVVGGEQTWALVRRTVNGATVRYVERLDVALGLDCAITASVVAPGQATWGGLAHLEGKLVRCVADGSDMGTFTVVGGQIALPRNALAVQIGLDYTSRIKLLTPELQTGTGSAQGQAMSTNDVQVNFLNTYACNVNGDPVAFRQFGSNLLDDPPPSFTGIKGGEELGWERGRSDIELSSNSPLGFHVRAVIREITVN